MKESQDFTILNLYVTLQVLPKDKINVTKSGVQIKVPAILNTDEIITINIQMTDVLKVSLRILTQHKITGFIKWLFTVYF